MKAFLELRKAALDKRDAAIRQVRDEYAATIKRIAELEQDIKGSAPSDHKTIAQCVQEVIPYGRTFTTVDIMAGLEAMAPHRIWRKHSIITRLTVLQEKGVIKRISRPKGGEPAVYARIDVEVDTQPFGDLSLQEAIATLLADRPSITQTDIIVALVESGYQTTMNKEALRNAVGTAMRNHPERFKRQNGNRWSLV